MHWPAFDGKRLQRALRVLHYVGMAFIVGIAGTTVVHVVGRYFFGHGVLGLVEISSLMQVVAVCLAGVYTMALGRHIAVGIVVDNLRQRTQAAIEVVTGCLSLGFTAVAAWQAYARGTFLLQAAQRTEVLGIPVFPFVYIVGICWTMFSLVIVMRVAENVKRVVTKT